MIRSLRRTAEQIPNVVCHFGWEFPVRYGSHPGVMAVSKLLELQYVTRMRATFTQEQVTEIKGFDDEVGRKAQLAFDNNLAINFLDMESIDTDLPRLVKER